MSVYMIVDVQIHESETYSEYVERVAAVVEAHQGRYLARGGRATSLVGDWRPERIVLIEFPTRELLERCFASEAYRRLAPLRERSTTARAVVVEGSTASRPDSSSSARP